MWGMSVSTHVCDGGSGKFAWMQDTLPGRQRIQNVCRGAVRATHKLFTSSSTLRLIIDAARSQRDSTANKAIEGSCKAFAAAHSPLPLPSSTIVEVAPSTRFKRSIGGEKRESLAIASLTTRTASRRFFLAPRPSPGSRARSDAHNALVEAKS